MGPTRLLAPDKTMLNQSVENMLNAGIGTPGAPSHLPATARHRGASERNEDIGVHAVRKGRKRSRHIHDLIIGHLT